MPHLVTTDSPPPHQTLYWRMALRGSAIRHGNWKLIQTPHHPTMLFDLSNDISEQTNLANENPTKVQELTQLHAIWSESLKDNPRWISGNSWAKYNRKLYDLDYETEQPTGNTTRH